MREQTRPEVAFGESKAVKAFPPARFGGNWREVPGFLLESEFWEELEGGSGLSIRRKERISAEVTGGRKASAALAR
jgi:hypothetical protein